MRNRANVTGFIHDLPVWVGENMDQNTFEARPSILNEEVHRHVSKSGITVSISYGGMFLFDFSAISLRHEEKSESMAAKLLGDRLETMNAFLACLYSRLRGGFHKSASLFAMTKMQAVVSSD